MAPALTARCDVWLMRLGVKMLHGRPYHPQTQGKDKRFHRTLYVELRQARRFADLAECQSRSETWRRIYTEQRPHEALNLAPPQVDTGQARSASPRPFPSHNATPHTRSAASDRKAISSSKDEASSYPRPSPDNPSR